MITGYLDKIWKHGVGGYPSCEEGVFWEREGERDMGLEVIQDSSAFFVMLYFFLLKTILGAHMAKCYYQLVLC